VSSLKTPPGKPSLDPHLIVSALLVVLAFGILASISNGERPVEEMVFAAPLSSPTNTPVGFTPTVVPTSNLPAQSQIIDSNGGLDTSLAIDINGFPVIAYRGDAGLKLARCIDLYCTNPIIRVLDPAPNSSYEHISLALLNDEIPLVSFYSSPADDLKLVRCADSTCSSHTLITVDSEGSVGIYSSLVLDASNNPVILYHDYTNGTLKLAYCDDNVACSAPTFRTLVELTVATPGPWGRLHTSVVLTSTGLPRIAYYDLNNDREVRLISCQDVGCNQFDDYVVSSSEVGKAGGSFVSLSLSPNDRAYVAYFSSGGRLLIARCELADCSLWTDVQVLDDLYGVGMYNSITMDRGFLPVVSYYNFSTGDLQLVTCNDSLCYSKTKYMLASQGNVGTWSSVVMRDHKPIVSYYDETQDQLVLYFGDYQLSSAPTPTLTPSRTTFPTNPSPLPTNTPTQTQTLFPTDTNTPTPTPSSTPTATYTPTSTNTPTSTLTPTNTSTPITLTAPPDATMAQNFFTMRTPTLSWGRVSWAVGYRIQVDDATDFNTTLVDYDQISADQPSFTLVSALANGTYYWRVCAERSQGVCGAWSATESFIISVP